LKSVHQFQDKDAVTSGYQKLMNDIQKYFSNKIHGKDLDELEYQLFMAVAWLRACDAIIEQTYPIADFEKKIANLEKRLDSTEDLLKSILLVLEKLVDNLDR
jgi:hypothetical protein